jgi:hypothetical protein
MELPIEFLHDFQLFYPKTFDKIEVEKPSFLEKYIFLSNMIAIILNFSIECIVRQQADQLHNEHKNCNFLLRLWSVMTIVLHFSYFIVHRIDIIFARY